MIFGNEIVNESVLSESGMLFDIIIENYALKCEYYNNCPEECLADNFSYAFLSEEEGFKYFNWPNPEILENIINILKAGDK